MFAVCVSLFLPTMANSEQNTQDLLVADLERSLELTQSVHPNPHRKMSIEEKESYIEEVANLSPEEYTKTDVLRAVSRLVSLTGDRNTFIALQIEEFEADEENGLTFPLKVSFVDGRLIMTDAGDEKSSLPVASEIIVINGKNVPEIVDEFGVFLNDNQKPFDIYGQMFTELFLGKSRAISTIQN